MTFFWESVYQKDYRAYSLPLERPKSNLGRLAREGIFPVPKKVSKAISPVPKAAHSFFQPETYGGTPIAEIKKISHISVALATIEGRGKVGRGVLLKDGSFLTCLHNVVGLTDLQRFTSTDPIEILNTLTNLLADFRVTFHFPIERKQEPCSFQVLGCQMDGEYIKSGIYRLLESGATATSFDYLFLRLALPDWLKDYGLAIRKYDSNDDYILYDSAGSLNYTQRNTCQNDLSLVKGDSGLPLFQACDLLNSPPTFRYFATHNVTSGMMSDFGANFFDLRTISSQDGFKLTQISSHFANKALINTYAELFNFTGISKQLKRKLDLRGFSNEKMATLIVEALREDFHKLNADTNNEKIEYGGWIFFNEKTSSFHFVRSASGTKSSCPIYQSQHILKNHKKNTDRKPLTFVGYVHSHPIHGNNDPTPGRPSGEDIIAARDQGTLHVYSPKFHINLVVAPAWAQAKYENKKKTKHDIENHYTTFYQDEEMKVCLIKNSF